MAFGHQQSVEQQNSTSKRNSTSKQRMNPKLFLMRYCHHCVTMLKFDQCQQQKPKLKLLRVYLEHNGSEFGCHVDDSPAWSVHRRRHVEHLLSHQSADCCQKSDGFARRGRSSESKDALDDCVHVERV
jgi:hypothetical protein